MEFKDIVNEKEEDFYNRTISVTEQKEYWHKNLSDLTHPVTFHTKNDYNTFSNMKKEVFRFKIPKNIKNKLIETIPEEKFTVFNVLFTAFNILIYRFTKQEDIAVGTFLLDKNQINKSASKESYLNSLVLRNKIDQGQDFHSLLESIQKTNIKAIKNKDVSFEELNKEITIMNENSKNSPLINTMFNYYSYKQSDKIFSENNFEFKKYIDNISFNMDTLFNLYDSTGDIEGEVQFSKAYYDLDFFQSFIKSFLTLLESIIINPKEKIELLNIISSADQDRLINNQERDDILIPENFMIYTLFDNIVKKKREDIAVIHEGIEYTYSQIDEISKKVGNILSNNGLEMGQRIGICLDRSPILIGTILAIWKLGLAYVPISKHWQKDYIKYIVSQSNIEVILHDNGVKNFDLPINAIGIDGDTLYNEDKIIFPPLPFNNGESLAYITFTSGTTGLPKGVLTKHTSVVNYLFYLEKNFLISSNDTVLQIPPITFDASIRDIFGTLSYGGKLVIPEEKEYSNPFHLAKLIQKYTVTCILSIVPSFAESITSTLIEHDYLKSKSLRLILLSGEPLKQKLIQELIYCFGEGIDIVNQYGPTEATLTSTFYHINKRQKDILIGKAIPNQKVYLLDDYLQIVPIGAIGNIYIGGIGLSEGYLNNVEMTTSSFITNPFSDSDRLYNTGDLAVIVKDLNLKHLGRNNRQVKIRGIRVELDSVETWLMKHSNIKKAVVIFEEDRNFLIAYLVGELSSLYELKEWVNHQLPITMQPNEIILVDEIPLKQNGKIDYASLEKKKSILPINTSVSLEELANKQEKMLIKIWKEILQANHIKKNDNFFFLGGDSLLATKLLSKIKIATDVDIPMAAIFDNPVLKDLAAYIESKLLEPKNQKKLTLLTKRKR